MIRAEYTPWIHRLLNRFGYGGIRRHFRRIDLLNEVKAAPDRGMLVLGNHFSWWDGFFISELNRKEFGKKYHVMMLEEELAERKFLRYGGCYGIRKNSRGIIEALQYSAELLDDPENLVLVYPQGSIQSQHEPEIIFEKGILRIMKTASRPFQLVFSVVLTDYLQHKKPIARHFLREIKWKPELDVEHAYNVFFEDCRARHRQMIGEEVG